MMKLLKRLFGGKSGRKNLTLMRVEKMAYDGISLRFLVFMKSEDESVNKTGLLVLEGMEGEEAIMLPLVFQNKVFTGFLNGAGIQVKEIILLNKDNTPDAAECVIRKGLFYKTIRISLLEAVIIGNEYDLPFLVSREILEPMMIGLNLEGEPVSSFMNTVNMQKILDDERYENEVIM
ncbi:MAG: hypothetical protein HPY53_06055 [Brevinematales bacterium]|nr:hypothetical protein [Brevinematales bacterium]